MWHADVPNGRGLSRKHILSAIWREHSSHGSVLIISTCTRFTPSTHADTYRGDAERAGRVRVPRGRCGTSGALEFRGMATDEGSGSRARAGPSHHSRPSSCCTHLANRDIEREHVGLCTSEGVAILPYSVLGGGLLTGKVRRGTSAAGSMCYRARPAVREQGDRLGT